MRKTNKIINIALIFMLIGAGLCSDAVYSCPVSRHALRVPVVDHERLEESLAGMASQGSTSSPNPIKKVGEDRIEFIGRNKGRFTVVQEAKYKDEEGVTHECFAKLGKSWGSEEIFITSQARILRFLNSRNIQGIPRVLDFVETENNRKIILFERFPEGMTLDEKMEVLSKESAVDIMLKVTRIVKSLLDQGVYHWDIKPENIWVTNEKEVILFDFDFAFMGRGEFINRELYIGGDLNFMSRRRRQLKNHLLREIFFSLTNETFSQGKSLEEIESQVYARLFSREILFSHSDEIFSLGKSLERIFLDKSQIPPDLQRLINKALAEDDAGKYETIDEFLRDLEKVMASMVAGNEPMEMIANARQASSNI